MARSVSTSGGRRGVRRSPSYTGNVEKGLSRRVRSRGMDSRSLSADRRICGGEAGGSHRSKRHHTNRRHSRSDSRSRSIDRSRRGEGSRSYHDGYEKNKHRDDTKDRHRERRNRTHRDEESRGRNRERNRELDGSKDKGYYRDKDKDRTSGRNGERKMDRSSQRDKCGDRDCERGVDRDRQQERSHNWNGSSGKAEYKDGVKEQYMAKHLGEHRNGGRDRDRGSEDKWAERRRRSDKDLDRHHHRLKEGVKDGRRDRKYDDGNRSGDKRGRSRSRSHDEGRRRRSMSREIPVSPGRRNFRHGDDKEFNSGIRGNRGGIGGVRGPKVTSPQNKPWSLPLLPPLPPTAGSGFTPNHSKNNFMVHENDPKNRWGVTSYIHGQSPRAWNGHQRREGSPPPLFLQARVEAKKEHMRLQIFKGMKKEQKKAIKRAVVTIDRTKTPPFLLRLFYKLDEEHTLTQFSVRGKEPVEDELQVYAWMDSKLRDICFLVKDVCPDARDRQAVWHFRLLYPDKEGKSVIADIGMFHSTIPDPKEDAKTLADVKFQIGDFLLLSIVRKKKETKPLLPRPDPRLQMKDGWEVTANNTEAVDPKASDLKSCNKLLQSNSSSTCGDEKVQCSSGFVRGDDGDGSRDADSRHDANGDDGLDADGGDVSQKQSNDNEEENNIDHRNQGNEIEKKKNNENSVEGEGKDEDLPKMDLESDDIRRKIAKLRTTMHGGSLLNASTSASGEGVFKDEGMGEGMNERRQEEEIRKNICGMDGGEGKERENKNIEITNRDVEEDYICEGKPPKVDKVVNESFGDKNDEEEIKDKKTIDDLVSGKYVIKEIGDNGCGGSGGGDIDKHRDRSPVHSEERTCLDAIKSKAISSDIERANEDDGKLKKNVKDSGEEGLSDLDGKNENGNKSNKKLSTTKKSFGKRCQKNDDASPHTPVRRSTRSKDAKRSYKNL